MKQKIWTMAKSSFMMMGGDPYYPISTDVEVLEEVKIRGFTFVSFKTPKGSVYVCEKENGGIVAPGFNELKENIKGVSTKELKKQLEQNKLENQESIGRYEHLPNDQFFKFFKF